MNTEDDLIRAGLREWAEASDRGDHPTDEELARYAEGELGDSRSEEIGDHLCLCRACSLIVLELTDGEEGDPESEWEAVRGRIEAPGEIAAIVAEGSRPTASVSRLPIGPAFMALAAALFGVVIGVSFGLGHGGPPQVGHPASDIQVYTVEGAKRSAPAQKLQVTVRPAASRVVLLLPARANRAPRYRVEAQNLDTLASWSPWVAVPDEWGNVPFEVIPSEHGLGLFSVKLTPIGSEDAAELAFELDLISDEAAGP